MPKKFKGENSKAVEAKAKKSAVRDAEKQRKDAAEEDERWRDDDKHVMRLQKRKEDKEQKRLEQLEKKKELQRLHDEEMDSLKSAKPTASVSTKVTRLQIQERITKADKEGRAHDTATAPVLHDEVPLEENINRQLSTDTEARSVEEAISVLSVKEPAIDMHPEKRVKAAYKAFEEKHLPVMRAENSNMRLSQLKHKLKQEWMKSPDNPLNQRLIQK